MDGKIVAVAYRDADATTTAISTYDLFSGTHIYSHRVSEGRIVASIWTHEEHLRFVTVKPGSIIVWEVGFTSIHTLTEVESFPVPENITYSGECLFLPALSRLAFTFRGVVLVLDIRNYELLLNSPGDQHAEMSFSPDGRFFACGPIGLGVHLWKESPTGYELHQKIVPGNTRIRPLLSPSGESIIILNQSTVRLWYTANPTPSSNAPTQFAEPASFILEFSSDETLAAVARLEEKTATVLDLRSGGPRLIIDTGMKVLGLGVTENTIVVVGEGKVVTWNLPARDSGLSSGANINDSVRTTTFDYSPPSLSMLVPSTSISHDLNRIAVARYGEGELDDLNIYDASTGKRITGTTIRGYSRAPWFTPDRREVWCIGDFSARGWTIVEDNESDLARLEPLGSTARPSGGTFPWRSPRGYEVMEDGWVINSDEKRLLWLPHHWRSDNTDRVWGERFLGLLRCELLEAVILELGEWPRYK